MSLNLEEGGTLPDFSLLNPSKIVAGCDHCEDPIDMSTRHQVWSLCIICVDFDLCQKCFLSNQHSHEHDLFWHVTKSSPRVTSAKTPWVAASLGIVPMGSLVAGKLNQDDLYIARVTINDELIPGTLYSKEGGCLITWNGLPDIGMSYETLILPQDEVNWVASNDGEVLPWAVAGGVTSDCEILYIGRVQLEGEIVVGRVQPSRNALYVAFQGAEVRCTEYELLVFKMNNKTSIIL